MSSPTHADEDDFSDVFDALNGYEDREEPAESWDDDWMLDPNMGDQS